MKYTDKDEIDRFEKAVESYFNLQIDVDRFTAMRLQQGVYGQRQEGVNMLRVKIPGGTLSPLQLETIAEVVETHSEHDIAHVTTRQAIQIHYIPLQQTPAAMRILAKSDLTTREACGNTVRSITGCPLAGVCPSEHVDVTPHIEEATLHFLRNPLSQQMPRKFKMAISGCKADCAQTMIHDLGAIAHIENGKSGFNIMAGGGLGHKPREAVFVDFVDEKDLLIAMEALISVHNKYSDRKMRARARIKFLIDRFGAEGFREKYRQEIVQVRQALASAPYPKGAWKNNGVEGKGSQGAPRKAIEQKQQGFYVFPLSLPLGEINSAQLRGLARLLKKNALHELKTTQDQNLIILNVPEKLVPALRSGLQQIGLFEPQTGSDVVACPGTSTCRLGITSSPALAGLLSGGSDDLKIRVSGCHNGCAQPETGDIGVYGEGRRIHGKLVPHYQLYLGGSGMGGQGLALKGPSLPSARIVAAVRRIQEEFPARRILAESFYDWSRRMGRDYFTALLADLGEVSPEQLPSVIADHGSKVEFKVLQLGGGECAGASQVRIGSTFFEAAHERHYRDALFFQRKYREATKCAESMLLLIGQGLIQLLGGQGIDDLAATSRELAASVPAELSVKFAAFTEQLGNKEIEAEKLPSLFRTIDAWTREAALFCQEKDSQLDLTEALPKAA